MQLTSSLDVMSPRMFFKGRSFMDPYTPSGENSAPIMASSRGAISAAAIKSPNMRQPSMQAFFDLT